MDQPTRNLDRQTQGRPSGLNHLRLSHYQMRSDYAQKTQSTN